MKLFKCIGIFLCVVVFARACFSAGPMNLDSILTNFNDFSYAFEDFSETLKELDELTEPLDEVLFGWDSALGVGENIYRILHALFIGPAQYVEGVLRAGVTLIIDFVAAFVELIKLFTSLFGTSAV